MSAVIGFDLEDAIDALCDVFMSPEFHLTLQRVYARKRVPMPLRPVEVVYGEEESAPIGYPCLELVSIASEKRAGEDSVLREHEISADWTVNGDQPQMMRREVQRLIQATVEHIEGASLLPYVGGSPMTTGRIDFSPLTGRRDKPAEFLKSGSVQLFWKSSYIRQG